MQTEQWLDIPGFYGYQVSDMGNVRSFLLSNGRKSDRPHIIQSSSYNGRRGVNLRKNGRTYYRKISVLVMLSFVGNRPPHTVIRHKNDVNSDDRLSNLIYGTQKENMQDAIENGCVDWLPDKEISQIRSDYSSGKYTITELSKKYNRSVSGISLIVRNKRRVLTSEKPGL